MREYYERHLPHRHPAGHTLFVTTRLAGSLPRGAAERLRAIFEDARKPREGEAVEVAARRAVEAQRQYFRAFEAQLDQPGYGPDWLSQPAIVALILHTLRHQAARGHYVVLAACAMPTHMHTVLTLPEAPAQTFERTWQQFKSYTARQANVILNRRDSAFWQHESYDHVVRDATGIGRVVRYTAENPVKASLCAHWSSWPGTYLAPDWHAALLADDAR